MIDPFIAQLRLQFRKNYSELVQRVVSGGFWSVLGETGTRLLTFLSAILIARILGIEGFGAFALVQGTLAMFTIFAAFGMGETMSRYIAAYRRDSLDRVTGLSSLSLLFSVAAGFAASSALYLAASYIAASILNRPDLTSVFQLASPALFFTAVAGSMFGILRGFESFKLIATLGWIAGLVSFCMVLAGVLHAGLKGAVVGLVCAELLRATMAVWCARGVMKSKECRLFGTGFRKEIPVIWQFSLPSFLGGALHTPAFWLCQMIIGSQADGVGQLGLYSAAQKWMTLVTFIPVAAANMMGPILSSLSGSDDVLLHRSLTLKYAAFQAAVCALPAIMVALLAPQVMAVFGKGFEDGALVLVWLMVLAPISISLRLLWQALLSMTFAWTSLFLWLIWAVAAVGLTHLLGGKGALGLAQAMTFAYGIGLVGHIIVMRRAWAD